MSIEFLGGKHMPLLSKWQQKKRKLGRKISSWIMNQARLEAGEPLLGVWHIGSFPPSRSLCPVSAPSLHSACLLVPKTPPMESLLGLGSAAAPWLGDSTAAPLLQTKGEKVPANRMREGESGPPHYLQRPSAGLANYIHLVRTLSLLFFLIFSPLMGVSTLLF